LLDFKWLTIGFSGAQSLELEYLALSHHYLLPILLEVSERSLLFKVAKAFLVHLSLLYDRLSFFLDLSVERI
jgi:hypothetical protein